MKTQDTTHDASTAAAAAAPVPTTTLPRRIARAPLAGAPGAAAAAPALGHSFAGAVNAGVGDALPDPIQQKFEASLGVGLGDVRVHAGGASSAAAESVSARAYATGSDIHFGAGQYDPSSGAGEHLLAHEVAHTVQQRGASTAPQAKLEITAPGDACETEADAAADAMVAGRPFAVSAAPAAIARTPHRMTAEPAHPERQPMQITGRYDAVAPGGDNRITMELNQAGTHFEGWWQQRGNRSGSGARMTHQRIEGNQTGTTADGATYAYERHREGGHPIAGTLTATGSGASYRVHLTEGSGDMHVEPGSGAVTIDQWDHDFRRTSEAPRLSDAGIAALPAEGRDLARAQEDAPLDTDEEQRLRANMGHLQQRVRDWLGESRGVPREAHASGIDAFVETVFAMHAPEQQPLVRQRVHELLVAPTFASGSITRPYWDWLAVIVATNPTFTTHIQQRLGMPATGIAAGPDAPQNHYNWRFDVTGLAGDVGFGLGAFLGTFTIEQVSGSARWSTQYFTVLGQVSGGLSAGWTVGMQTSNSFQSPFPWRSGNFRGAYTITGVAAGGAVLEDGGAQGAGFINFFGDGTFPVVSGDAGGFTAMQGLYIGAEMSQAGGYLSGGRDEAIAYARAHRPREVTGTYGAGAAAHFAVDDPALTALGWSALREACALHRAMLVNPRGTIAITGYASPSGADGHNLTLSGLRANNTLQAIRDIMGADLAIPATPEAQSAIGLGEAPARAAGIPDGQESDVWRKVDVAMNGTVVLTLRY